MNKKVLVKDCTLANSETDKNVKISFKEKLELVKRLETVNIDIIEISYADSSQSDFIAAKSIASTLQNSILSIPVRPEIDSIKSSYDAIKNAKNPRLHIAMPVSIVGMEYVLNMKKDAVLDTVKQSVAFAKSLCPDVEFTALDATRTQEDFLLEILNAAAQAGANTLGIEDSEGYMMPHEASSFFQNLKQKLPADLYAKLSFRAKNNLGMAVANSMAAVQCGISTIICAIKGSSMDANLEECVMALKTRGVDFNRDININTSQINRAVSLLSGISEEKVYNYADMDSVQDTKKVIYIDKEMDLYTFRSLIEDMGYTLMEKDLEKIYRLFKELSDKKSNIYVKDIDALIAREAVQVPRVYQLDDFVINSGNNITATASVRLSYKDKKLEAVSLGDGPIDAAFHVIEQMMGMDIELFDYSLKSVTEGKDALGAATVKIRYNGQIYIGRGLSTDVIESSIMAYLNAVNKMLYEEDIQ